MWSGPQASQTVAKKPVPSEPCRARAVDCSWAGACWSIRPKFASQKLFHFTHNQRVQIKAMMRREETSPSSYKLLQPEFGSHCPRWMAHHRLELQFQEI